MTFQPRWMCSLGDAISVSCRLGSHSIDGMVSAVISLRFGDSSPRTWKDEFAYGVGLRVLQHTIQYDGPLGLLLPSFAPWSPVLLLFFFATQTVTYIVSYSFIT